MVDPAVAERIRNVRREHGRGQTWLAAQIGVPASSWSRAENGKRRIDVDELVRVAEALDVPVAYLLGIETPPSLLLVTTEPLTLEGVRAFMNRAVDDGGVSSMSFTVGVTRSERAASD